MNVFYYKLFLFVITSVFDQAYIPRFLIKIAFLYTYSLMAFWRIRIYFHVHCLDLFALAIVCLVVLMHQVYFLFFFNVQSMYSSSNYRDLLYSLHLTLTLISADLQIKVATYKCKQTPVFPFCFVVYWDGHLCENSVNSQ